MPPLNQALYRGKGPGGGPSLGRYAPVVGLTVLITLAVSNLLKTAPPEHRAAGGPGEFIPSRAAAAGSGEPDYRQSPRWELPEEWRQKVGTGQAAAGG